MSINFTLSELHEALEYSEKEGDLQKIISIETEIEEMLEEMERLEMGR